MLGWVGASERAAGGLVWFGLVWDKACAGRLGARSARRFVPTRLGRASRGCPVARPAGLLTVPRRWHMREGDAAVPVCVARGEQLGGERALSRPAGRVGGGAVGGYPNIQASK